MNTERRGESGHAFAAFGLSIDSELDLPELLPLRDATPDVRVRYGAVPEQLVAPRAQGVCYQAAPGEFLLRVRGTARYWVRDGRDVLIERFPGAADEDVRLFLLGSAFGALLHQRGLLPLHGSAVADGADAFVFLGTSGSGKSTLAAAYVRRGCRLLADDVCTLSVPEEAPPVIYPAYPQLKLWDDAVRKLGEDPSSLPRVRASLRKHALNVDRDFADGPLPVRRLYAVMATHEPGVRLTPLSGRDKLTVLVNQTYRIGFLGGLGGKDRHFLACSRLAARASVVRVERPRRPFLLEELVERIEEDRRAHACEPEAAR